MSNTDPWADLAELGYAAVQPRLNPSDVKIVKRDDPFTYVFRSDLAIDRPDEEAVEKEIARAFLAGLEAGKAPGLERPSRRPKPEDQHDLDTVAKLQAVRGAIFIRDSSGALLVSPATAARLLEAARKGLES